MRQTPGAARVPSVGSSSSRGPPGAAAASSRTSLHKTLLRKNPRTPAVPALTCYLFGLLRPFQQQQQQRPQQRALTDAVSAAVTAAAVSAGMSHLLQRVGP